MRRRNASASTSSAIAAAPPDGVVRANDRPFGFEADLRNEREERRVRMDRPIRRPPRRRSPPAIALGGSLLASTTNELVVVRRRQPLSSRPRPNPGGAGNEHPLHRGHRARRHLQLYGYHDEPEDDLGMGFLFDIGAGGRYGRDPWAELYNLPEVDYQPMYTHPTPVEPSFTFDFATSPPTSLPVKIAASPPSSRSNPIVIDDDDVDLPKVTEPLSPSLSMNNVLVCANCLAPLVLGGGDETEARESKVWGLRCGHIIDGKCLEKLAFPMNHDLPILGEEDPKGKGKGKARTVDSPVAPPGDPPFIPYHDPSEPNPIRSRLRSSGQVNASFYQQLLPSVPSFFKRSTKPKKPKIEAQHAWSCPVSGCGKMHTSIKMDGVWMQEKEKGEGAIGLFV